MSSAQNNRIVQIPQEEAGAIFASLRPLFFLPKSEQDITDTMERLGDGTVTLFTCEGKGFALYVDRPRYAPFLRFNIPEIQDVNVHPDCRQQGIATALIKACEKFAKDEGHMMIGIGVGVSANYGPAQRLYAKLGYLPDGAGLVYDGEPVPFGVSKPNDDDLCMMMTKDL